MKQVNSGGRRKGEKLSHRVYQSLLREQYQWSELVLFNLAYTRLPPSPGINKIGLDDVQVSCTRQLDRRAISGKK